MTIAEKFQEHLDGLIGGWELRESEALWWIRLLESALTESDPVHRAKFYGFESVNSVQDIHTALTYLAPIAAGSK